MANEQEKIRINTTRFGELEVASSAVIHVIAGVIGFPGISRYILLEYNPPFSWLQSVDQPDLAFVVVNGAEFGEHYLFDLPMDDPELDLKETDDISVINLVAVRPAPHETTVNLKAPLIVNMRNLKARQIILDDPRFPMRFPLWDKSEKKE